MRPEDVVKKQLDAYNARDIDSFMSVWAEGAQYFAHPATLLASGAAAIRERHLVRFREPDLHGELISRVVLGNPVVDHERVTRTFPEGPETVEVVAVYQFVEKLRNPKRNSEKDHRNTPPNPNKSILGPFLSVAFSAHRKNFCEGDFFNELL